MTRYLTCWILPDLLPENGGVQEKMGEKQTEKQYSFFFRMASLLNIYMAKKKENNLFHPCLINSVSFSGSGVNMC